MSDRVLQVIEPGLLSTVQDLGRPGLMRFGVTPGGAADRSSLILGNLLVGNERGAAGLEVTLLGPRLRFSSATVIAVSGADLGASLNGRPLPSWQPHRVNEGDDLAFAATGAKGRGARAYCCIAGGVTVEPVMGSRATDLFGGFGGWQGRTLRAGDILPLGAPAAPIDQLLSRRLVLERPAFDDDPVIRVVLGPQLERFTADGIATFLAERFTVTPRSDRMGLRLSGPPVALGRGADMISEGIAHGAVQVPGDGQPIVLLGARQTIGGYPKIATAIGADGDRLGQLGPGDTMQFAEVDVAEARAATLAYAAALADSAVAVAPRAGHGWTRTDDEDTMMEKDQRSVDHLHRAWDAAGVARLITALSEADVTYLRLEIVSAGVNLEIHRGEMVETTGPPPGSASASESTGDTADSAASDLITAPLLGLFYRRAAPDQPPFAEVGSRVEVNQPVGVIEVMKTYHEVCSPRAGVIEAFLIEDEASIQYGEPIARLAPVE